jgi:hypothetical protein
MEEDVSKIMSLLSNEELVVDESGKTSGTLPPPLTSHHEGLISSNHSDPGKPILEDVISTVKTIFWNSSSQESASPSKKRKKSSKTEDLAALDNEYSQEHWMQKWAELKEFQKLQGHSNPSYLHDSQLYGWLHRQRFLFRKGKLSQERFELLREVGVNFEYHWDEMFQQYKQWKETHNTFIVPADASNKLAYWIHAQVCSWRNKKLSEDKIKKLQEIGVTLEMEMDLKPHRIYKKREKGAPGDSQGGENLDNLLTNSPDLHQSFGKQTFFEKKSEQNWLQMYSKIKKFKEENKSFNVPLKMDKKLALWIRTQKKSFKERKLADWKFKSLQSIDFFSPQEISTFMETSQQQQQQQPNLEGVFSLQISPDPLDGMVHTTGAYVQDGQATVVNPQMVPYSFHPSQGHHPGTHTVVAFTSGNGFTHVQPVMLEGYHPGHGGGHPDLHQIVNVVGVITDQGHEHELTHHQAIMTVPNGHGDLSHEGASDYTHDHPQLIHQLHDSSSDHKLTSTVGPLGYEVHHVIATPNGFVSPNQRMY